MYKDKVVMCVGRTRLATQLQGELLSVKSHVVLKRNFVGYLFESC